MPGWNILANIASVVAIAAAAAIAFYELRELQKQQHIEVFTKYTERYSDIVDNLKDAVYSDPDKSTLASSKSDVEEYEKLMQSIRKFFNLCSEEFWLAGGDSLNPLKEDKLPTGGKISKEVWDLWKSGIEYHMKIATFVDGWERVGKQREGDDSAEGYSRNFTKFMNDKMYVTKNKRSGANMQRPQQDTNSPGH